MSPENVRAALAILFTVAIIGGFFLDKVASEVFFAVASSAITYYYTKTGTEQQTAKLLEAHRAQIIEIQNAPKAS